MPELSAENVSYGVGTLLGGGLLIRLALSFLTRQGLITAGDNSQRSLIEDLRAEAKKWQDLHEKTEASREKEREQHEKDMLIIRQAHNDNLVLLGEMRNQNKMLRMLLIQRGMSASELDAALEVQLDTASC